MKKIMFTFDSGTLKHLLLQLKNEIDKKTSIEQYAIKTDEGAEDGLVVGVDILIEDKLIVDLMAKGVEIANGDKVLVRDKVLSEMNFTQAEKDALKEIIEGGGIPAILDKRLDNLSIEVVTKEQYEEIKDSDAGLELEKLYIVTNEEKIIFELDNYALKNEFNAMADTKVDKEKYTYLVDGEEVEADKVLSEINFTQAHAAIVNYIISKGGVDSLIVKDQVVDNLESSEVNKALSANQGRIIKEDYLANKRHVYLSQEAYNALTEEDYEDDVIYHIEDADVLYGLTEEQLLHLKRAYEYTLLDFGQDFASKSEVYQARASLDGKYHASLADRLLALDSAIDNIINDFDNVQQSLARVYGVHVDFEEQEITRLMNSEGKEGGHDFDICFPWAGMRRCNMIDGEVVAWEGDMEYAEDGSNGDVMVRIPKFYYRVVPVRTEAVEDGEGLQLLEAEWYVSDLKYESFKVHPAFIRNGKEVDEIYVGAFEACLFDASAGIYVNNDVAYDTNNDTLGSVAGFEPKLNISATQARRFSKNNGEGYQLVDFSVHSAFQLLFLIEYASFDTQSCIDQGIVIEAELCKTGHEKAVVYRGVENLWGNTWNRLDGFICYREHNTSPKILYWSNNELSFDNPSGYNKISFTFKVSDYITRFGYDSNNDFVFMPTKGTGSTSLFPHDSAIYAGNDYCGSSFGGAYAAGTGAGLWCFNSSTHQNMGFDNDSFRIQFIKQ